MVCLRTLEYGGVEQESYQLVWRMLYDAREVLLGAKSTFSDKFLSLMLLKNMNFCVRANVMQER